MSAEAVFDRLSQRHPCVVTGCDGIASLAPGLDSGDDPVPMVFACDECSSTWGQDGKPIKVFDRRVRHA